MTSAMQIALTATPLAAYFYTLGVFHSGSRPRMISGPADIGLLACGLGGLVAFGPFGFAVLGRLAGDGAGILAWSIWVGLIGVWSLVMAGSATLRVTVYHASPDELDLAVREALSHIDGHFSRTLKGYEDHERGYGVTVKTLRWFRSGSVETYGRSPELLIRELKPRFQEALSHLPQKASGVSHTLFGLACVTMLVPVSSFFVANPRAQDALRALLHSLRWW